jgi:hypothetical protein
MRSTGRYRWVRRGVFSGLAGVVVCAVVAAPVWAFASRRTHVAIVPAPFERQAFGSSTATCPSGQHVLFGGFKNGSSMRRTANDRWTAYASNEGFPPYGSPPISLSSYVYCGYGPVPSKATSTVGSRLIPGGADVTATARCPAGTVVVAGGFATPPRTDVDVTDLERVASDLWRVSGFVPGGRSLTAIAYCGPGPAPKLVSQTVTTFDHAGYLGLARATCREGTHLVFGGAIVIGGVGAAFQTLRVPAKTKDTWAVTGSHGETFRGGRLTALAYCR